LVVEDPAYFVPIHEENISRNIFKNILNEREMGKLRKHLLTVIGKTYVELSFTNAMYITSRLRQENT
jgi:hypothetical protein